MNNRDRALEELKRRIQEQQARVDPEILRRAREAAMSQVDEAPRQGEARSVPYDRETAEEAVRLFLARHRNARDFERKLAEFIFRNRH